MTPCPPTEHTLLSIEALVYSMCSLADVCDFLTLKRSAVHSLCVLPLYATTPLLTHVTDVSQNVYVLTVLIILRLYI